MNVAVNTYYEDNDNDYGDSYFIIIMATLFFLTLLCGRACACHYICAEVRDSLQELVSSFHHVHPGSRTRFIRLGRKCLYSSAILPVNDPCLFLDANCVPGSTRCLLCDLS